MRVGMILLSLSAIVASVFVIGSTLAFDWTPTAKALIVMPQLGLIGVNAWLIRNWYRPNPRGYGRPVET